MIKFDLAKQLKDMGFPQEPAIDISGVNERFMGGFYYLLPPKAMDGGEVAPNFLDQREYETRINSGLVCAYGEMVKIPQLEELIEATVKLCKGGKFSLSCDGLIDWLSVGNNYQLFAAVPDEAVAKLWCAFNAKG